MAINAARDGFEKRHIKPRIQSHMGEHTGAYPSLRAPRQTIIFHHKSLDVGSGKPIHSEAAAKSQHPDSVGIISIKIGTFEIHENRK